MVLYVLYEHATGYAVFKSIAAEDIGSQTDEVQQSMIDLGKFGKTLKLLSFSPFKSGANALENANSVSEGIVTDELRTLLEANVPRGKKSTKVVLGVGDHKIGSAIQEALQISCQAVGVVPELLRGIRLHFPKLVSGLSSVAAVKAQLGLGHAYSRAKVKFNVHRVDNMIIQTIALVDQLDKDINTFSMRIREWYSYHFPELVKIITDNYMYARVAGYIKSRKDLSEERLEGLEEIVMDTAKVKAIHDASRSSMGMDISPIDLINIERFAVRVTRLAEYRKELFEYLHKKMVTVAPSVAALIGDIVGARLISHAGSLTNLAKYPASTVQILGAEKALFRALKTKGNTPKYGLIYHSSFIGKAGAKNKGRISRYLANKCSIAARIDCFSDVPSEVFGEKLRDQVEERLSFYETGQAPRRNVDVMKEAMEEMTQAVGTEAAETPKKTPKKNKKKKRKHSETEEEPVEEEPQEEETTTPKKKKKKKKKADE
eukprot:scpid60405/ scgid28454/ Nucleolar protein 56; Nucleolar protein 5A